MLCFLLSATTDFRHYLLLNYRYRLSFPNNVCFISVVEWNYFTAVRILIFPVNVLPLVFLACCKSGICGSYIVFICYTAGVSTYFHGVDPANKPFGSGHRAMPSAAFGSEGVEGSPWPISHCSQAARALAEACFWHTAPQLRGGEKWYPNACSPPTQTLDRSAPLLENVADLGCNILLLGQSIIPQFQMWFNFDCLAQDTLRVLSFRKWWASASLLKSGFKMNLQK